MLLLMAVLMAAAPLAGAKMQQEAEDRARAEVTDLLRALCPEQCVLLSVRAQMDEEDTGGQVSPGFDAPGARTVPVVRSVNASVLVDKRLPLQFRTRVKALIAQRLNSAAVPAEIALEQVAFPVKNPPYLEAREPLPAQAKPPAPEPAKEEALPINAATPVSSRLQEKLLEQAPLLAVMVLLGTVVLALGGLIFLAARKPQEQYLTEPLPAEQPQSAAPASLSAESFPATRLRKLEKQLVDDRVLRNAVVREALGRGEHALVARWVRELGDFLLDDMRGDGALAQSLASVARELVKLPADPAARVAAVQDLEGRTLAARLSRTGDATAFSFLEGVREESFAAALRSISPGAQEVALRLAPEHLRSAALRDMPAPQRQGIALAWVRKPEVSAQYALAAADELRECLAGMHAGSAEMDRALGDLLDSLGREDQDALIDELRREGDPRAVSGLLTESALANAPADLLAASLLGIAPSMLVAYLSGTDDAARGHVLAACPEQVRREVEEELSLRPGTSRDDFLVARRELLSQVRQETLKRGLKPSDVRAWRPRVVKSP
jgi:hypothetical protein